MKQITLPHTGLLYQCGMSTVLLVEYVHKCVFVSTVVHKCVFVSTVVHKCVFVSTVVHKCVFVSTVVHKGVHVCDSDIHCMAHVHRCHMMAFMT